MRDRQRKTETWRSKEKRKKENKTKIGDTDKEAETIRRMLSLHHYFNTHSPSTDSSSSFFLLFALPLIFSLYYSSSLFQSLSLVFISLFLSFSVFQILRQMSHEIFAIETQRELYVSVSMCVWVAGSAHARACVCVCSF